MFRGLVVVAQVGYEGYVRGEKGGWAVLPTILAHHQPLPLKYEGKIPLLKHTCREDMLSLVKIRPGGPGI